MTVAPADRFSSEQGSTPIDLVNEALELLDQERSVFLNGQYERLAGIISAKTQILERLEIVIHSATRSAAFMVAVRSLIEVSRRNEHIIRAAQQGLAHARRRLKAIDQTREGAVAYAEDGSRISSHADVVRDRKTA